MSKSYKKLFLSLFISLLASQFSIAQGICNDVIATSGNSEQNATHSVSWTVGEVVTETTSGASNDMTQGFHQTNFCFKATSIESLNSGNLSNVMVFPNPFEESITIDLRECEGNLFNYSITDLHGKVISVNGIAQQDRIQEKSRKLNLSGISEAIYFLTITNEVSSKTIKIIKIN